MTNQFFDFKQNNIEEMSLETLKRTYRENDIYGNPLRGLYHFQVIEKVAQISGSIGSGILNMYDGTTLLLKHGLTLTNSINLVSGEVTVKFAALDIEYLELRRVQAGVS